MQDDRGVPRCPLCGSSLLDGGIQFANESAFIFKGGWRNSSAVCRPLQSIEASRFRICWILFPLTCWKGYYKSEIAWSDWGWSSPLDRHQCCPEQGDPMLVIAWGVASCLDQSGSVWPNSRFCNGFLGVSKHSKMQPKGEYYCVSFSGKFIHHPTPSSFALYRRCSWWRGCSREKLWQNYRWTSGDLSFNLATCDRSWTNGNQELISGFRLEQGYLVARLRKYV